VVLMSPHPYLVFTVSIKEHCKIKMCSDLIQLVLNLFLLTPPSKAKAVPPHATEALGGEEV
jgi:hypothetical protein